MDLSLNEQVAKISTVVYIVVCFGRLSLLEQCEISFNQ